MKKQAKDQLKNRQEEELTSKETTSHNGDGVSSVMDVETEEKEKDPKSTDEEGDLKSLQDEVAAAKDKYLRLYAEFENYRRRTSQEKIDMIQHANERLLTALLPVVDDFHRAEEARGESLEKSVEGFRLIKNKLQQALSQFGVQEIKTQPGADFDADIHEAVTKTPTDDEALKGKVVDVIEKGYRLHDRVIRYAKIVVGE